MLTSIISAKHLIGHTNRAGALTKIRRIGSRRSRRTLIESTRQQDPRIWFGYCLRVTLVSAILLTLVSPMRSSPTLAAGAKQTSTGQTITLEPPLRLDGHSYVLKYRTHGPYSDSSSRLFELITPENVNSRGVVAVNLFRDGRRVTEQEELERVLTVYNAAHFLYDRPKEVPVVVQGFSEELQKVTKNVLFAQLKGLLEVVLSSRQEEILQTMRTFGVVQDSGGIEQFVSATASAWKSEGELVEAIEATAKLGEFSTLPGVREVAKEARLLYKDWAVFRTLSVLSIGEVDIGLTDGLDFAAIALRMAFVTSLDQERTALLRNYLEHFAGSNEGLDKEQSAAARQAIEESKSLARQRDGLFKDFAKQWLVDKAAGVGEKAIAEKFVSVAWKTFGKRTTGHIAAGAASSVSLGLTLGNLLIGNDAVYDHFRLAERSDELYRKFGSGRLRLSQNAAASKPVEYDGRQAEQYQSAYMLEALAGAQALRSYCDGVDAINKRPFGWLLNLVQSTIAKWYPTTTWADAVKDLRATADATEREAEGIMGHPASVAALLAVALNSPDLDTNELPVPGFASTMLSFDVSRSMAEADQTGMTKIDAARDAAERVATMISLENQREDVGQRAGIVAFSDDATLVQPLTTDMNAVRDAIRKLEPIQSTNLAAGLKLAGDELGRAVTDTRKVLVLLSDGVPTSGINVDSGGLGSVDSDDLKREIREDVLPQVIRSTDCLYVVGFGEPGVQIDDQGRGIDEALLKEIASAHATCGGYYNASTADELANVYVKLRHESTGRRCV